MKNSFNFIQVANWVYVLATKLKNFRLKLNEEKVSKDEALAFLRLQKQQLELIKEILDKKTIISGVQPDFIKNLSKIKKQFGIEEQ